MAERDKPDEPAGPSPERMHDYDFLDKKLDGYPPGTTFEIDGEEVDVSALPDPFRSDDDAQEE